jgi:gliding motility-associated-like protein
VAFIAPPVVDLGNDTAICNGDVLLLDAGNAGATFQWSTGATTQTIAVNSADDYAVTVSAVGCSATDSVQLSLIALPVFSLGNDTTLCVGEQLTLDPAYVGASYSWSTTATTQQITVSTTGLYSLTITDNGCSYSDSVQVTFNPLPVVNLGNDTAICSGSSLVLDASYSGATYLWSTGSTSATIPVSTANSYAVTVTLSGCTAADTIVVGVLPLPVVNLGPDVVACTGSAVVLDAGSGFSGYQWSEGSSTQQITVTQPGSYSVTVSQNGCTASDVVQVSFDAALLVDLGADVSICAGESTTLDAQNSGAQFTWSTGETTGQITVSSAGIYSVTVTAGTCSATDAAQVTVNALPVVTATNDTVLCEGQTIYLSANTAAQADYLWSNGETTALIAVTTEGIYTVTATDANGCSGVSAVGVTLFCPTDVFIPNAFSPNGDAVNDVLHIYGEHLQQVHWMIFNRWGELVFETRDPSQGWNGMYQGEPLMPAVFVYFCRLTVADGRELILKGDVTLLR